VLLLEAGPSFIKRNAEKDESFALLAQVEDSTPPRITLLFPALFLVVAMMAVVLSKKQTIFVCALVVIILMVCLGILSEQEVRKALPWNLFIIIGVAFGIGSAMLESGVAEAIATALVDLAEAMGIGDIGLYGAIYVLTSLVANILTNNATAALAFPIAIEAAEQAGIDRMRMSYCIMLSASSSYINPFSYQCNLMVFGPGGYKFKDFIKIGVPLQIYLLVVGVFILSAHASVGWTVSGAIFAGLILFRLLEGKISKK